MNEEKKRLLQQELDELVIRIFLLINQYIKCKINIENAITSGTFGLFKARYARGKINISSLQLPSSNAEGVTAKFRVNTISTNNPVRFETIDVVEKQTSNLKCKLSDKCIIDESKISKSLENLDLNSKISENPTRKFFSDDPLKWFGFLVPEALKQSKVTFEKCLEVIVEAANVQSEILYSINEFKLKRRLLNEFKITTSSS